MRTLSQDHAPFMHQKISQGTSHPGFIAPLQLPPISQVYDISRRDHVHDISLLAQHRNPPRQLGHILSRLGNSR